MEIEEFVARLQVWHEHQVKQLRLIVDQPGAVIQIKDVNIEPGSPEAKGFRSGVAVALELLGKLPFTVEHDEDEDEDATHINETA